MEITYTIYWHSSEKCASRSLALVWRVQSKTQKKQEKICHNNSTGVATAIVWCLCVPIKEHTPTSSQILMRQNHWFCIFYFFKKEENSPRLGRGRRICILVHFMKASVWRWLKQPKCYPELGFAICKHKQLLFLPEPKFSHPSEKIRNNTCFLWSLWFLIEFI